MRKVRFETIVYDEHGQPVTEEVKDEKNIDPSLTLTRTVTKIRYGFIHHWGQKIFINEDKMPIPYSVCYIEDMLSGKIYEVEPYNVRFCKDNKK